AGPRRFLSWFYPVSLNICEDRFNFGTGFPISQHQMKRIATGLIRTAGVTGKSPAAKDEAADDMKEIFETYCKAGGSDVLTCDTPIPPEVTCPMGGAPTP